MSNTETLLSIIPAAGIDHAEIILGMAAHGIDNEKSVNGLLGFCQKNGRIEKRGDRFYRTGERPEPAPTANPHTALFNAIERLELRMSEPVKPVLENASLKIAVLERLAPILDAEIASILNDMIHDYEEHAA